MAWSALGACGTFTCAVLILLEAAWPRPVRQRKKAWGAGRAGDGAGDKGGSPGGAVFLELYTAAVAFVPVTAAAQVRLLAPEALEGACGSISRSRSS